MSNRNASAIHITFKYVFVDLQIPIIDRYFHLIKKVVLSDFLF